MITWCGKLWVSISQWCKIIVSSPFNHSPYLVQVYSQSLDYSHALMLSNENCHQIILLHPSFSLWKVPWTHIASTFAYLMHTNSNKSSILPSTGPHLWMFQKWHTSHWKGTIKLSPSLSSRMWDLSMFLQVMYPSSSSGSRIEKSTWPNTLVQQPPHHTFWQGFHLPCLNEKFVIKNPIPIDQRVAFTMAPHSAVFLHGLCWGKCGKYISNIKGSRQDESLNNFPTGIVSTMLHTFPNCWWARNHALTVTCE